MKVDGKAVGPDVVPKINAKKLTEKIAEAQTAETYTVKKVCL